MQLSKENPSRTTDILFLLSYRGLNTHGHCLGRFRGKDTSLSACWPNCYRHALRYITDCKFERGLSKSSRASPKPDQLDGCKFTESSTGHRLSKVSRASHKPNYAALYEKATYKNSGIKTTSIKACIPALPNGTHRRKRTGGHTSACIPALQAGRPHQILSRRINGDRILFPF